MRRAPLAVTVTSAAALLLAACNGDGNKNASNGEVRTPSPAAAAAVAADTTDSGTAESESSPAGGRRPVVDGTPQAAFLEALDDIDPRIVDGRDDTAVSRGREICLDFAGHRPVTMVVSNAKARFTGAVTVTIPQARRIVQAAMDHLCKA